MVGHHGGRGGIATRPSRLIDLHRFLLDHLSRSEER